MTQLLDGDERIATPVEAGLDGSTFEARLEPYRRELHVHCYRMLGSFDDADEIVRETFVRAWHRRQLLDRDSWFRAWLYRIATNACFDALGSSARRTPPSGAGVELSRLQPYPDVLLDEIGSGATSDDSVVVTRGSIALGYIAALQLLPPRQRAALILRDVMGWSMRETAGLLDTTMVAANSALQRARAAMPPNVSAGRCEWSATEPSTEDRSLLDRYIDQRERAGDRRLVPTAANRQPAAAVYVRSPEAGVLRASGLDVLHIEGGAIAEVTTFDARVLQAFGLPRFTVESVIGPASS